MTEQQRFPSRVALPYLSLWRAWRGWNGVELAREAGISRMTVFNLESGRATANLVTVYKLARALGITRKQLIEEEPPEEWAEHPEPSKESEKEGRAIA